MSIIGKLHEVSFYGLISTIVCTCTDKTSFKVLWETATHVDSFITFFTCFLFWSSVLFVPIAVIGAFSTKYSDGGKGLVFESDNLVVIIFAHIAEELLGLVSTPIWFLKDLFTKNLDDGGRVFDYTTYAIEILFFLIGILVL